MNRIRLAVGALLMALLVSGCALKEVRSKSKFGPEFRDRGDRTNEVRWTSIEQGFDFKWDRGWKTGITYRRRDTDEGGGGNDNGVWIDFSFPIWQAERAPDTTAKRIEVLERRLAQLESDRASAGGERVAERVRRQDEGGSH